MFNSKQDTDNIRLQVFAAVPTQSFVYLRCVTYTNPCAGFYYSANSQIEWATNTIRLDSVGDFATFSPFELFLTWLKKLFKNSVYDIQQIKLAFDWSHCSLYKSWKITRNV